MIKIVARYYTFAGSQIKFSKKSTTQPIMLSVRYKFIITLQYVSTYTQLPLLQERLDEQGLDALYYVLKLLKLMEEYFPRVGHKGLTMDSSSTNSQS